MNSMYDLYKIKKHIFKSKLFDTLKLSKLFFSVQCTGCVVRWSAEISRRTENIQALLKIGKN